MLEENRRLRKAKDCLKKICRLQKGENEALTSEVDRLREENSALRDVAERLETRWAELLGKHQAAVGDLDRNQRALTEKSDAVGVLTEDLAAAKTGRESADAALEATQADLASTREQLQHTTAEKAVLSDHVSRLLAEQELNRRELDSTHADFAEAQRMLREEAQTAASAQGQLAGEKKLRDQAEQERIRAEAALKQDAVDKVEQELLQRRLREVEGALRESHSQIAALQEARTVQASKLRESAAMLDRQRAQLEVMQKRELNRSVSQAGIGVDFE